MIVVHVELLHLSLFLVEAYGALLKVKIREDPRSVRRKISWSSENGWAFKFACTSAKAAVTRYTGIHARTYLEWTIIA